MILLVLCMITFYSTSFDSITLVAASYSYRELNHDQDPDRRVKLFWAVFLILLPIALIFSEKSMTNLQSVSIIAAFPVGIIMILIIVSFFKDAGNYLKEKTWNRFSDIADFSWIFLDFWYSLQSGMKPLNHLTRVKPLRSFIPFSFTRFAFPPWFDG